MALDQLLEKLVTKKDGKRTTSDKYNSKTLVDTAENLSKLETIDLTTTDGLKAYSTMTGDDTSKYSQKELEFRKKARFIGGNRDYSEYINEHFKDVVDGMSEEDRINLSFKYCPENEMEGNYKPFNDTTETVRGSKKILEEIAKDPKKYVSTELKDESKIMTHYITMFTDEFLQIRQGIAQRTAVLSIEKYDEGNAGKFLKTTKQHIDAQSKKITDKEEEVAKYFETNRGSDLKATEAANLLKGRMKELEELTKKYSDAQMLSSFTQETTTFAIHEIRKNNGYEPTEVKLSSIIGPRYDISENIFEKAISAARNERNSNNPARPSSENLEERTESTESNQPSEGRSESNSQEQNTGQ